MDNEEWEVELKNMHSKSLMFMLFCKGAEENKPCQLKLQQRHSDKLIHPIIDTFIGHNLKTCCDIISELIICLSIHPSILLQPVACNL